MCDQTKILYLIAPSFAFLTDATNFFFFDY